MRLSIKLGLKAVVSIICLYFIFRSIGWPDVVKAFNDANYLIVILALMIFWTAQIFSSWRCVYVARTLGGGLSLSTSLRAHFVGLWFNQIMPTSLGGDVIKMAILRKPLGLNMAIRCVILERISGLMFLLLATSLALPLYAKIFSPYPKFILSLSIIAVGGLLFIIFGAWISVHIYAYSTLSPIFVKLIQIFYDVWLFRKGIPLWRQVWTSAIVHLNGVFTYALIAAALGVDVELVSLLLAVPVVFLISSIPFSFAGWGLREAGAVWVFGMVGIAGESALAMSVSFGLLLVIAGLPGVVLFIRGDWDANGVK